jgi:hypothetical protein
MCVVHELLWNVFVNKITNRLKLGVTSPTIGQMVELVFPHRTVEFVQGSNRIARFFHI